MNINHRPMAIGFFESFILHWLWYKLLQLKIYQARCLLPQRIWRFPKNLDSDGIQSCNLTLAISKAKTLMRLCFFGFLSNMFHVYYYILKFFKPLTQAKQDHIHLPPYVAKISLPVHLFPNWAGHTKFFHHLTVSAPLQIKNEYKLNINLY